MRQSSEGLKWKESFWKGCSRALACCRAPRKLDFSFLPLKPCFTNTTPTNSTNIYRARIGPACAKALGLQMCKSWGPALKRLNLEGRQPSSAHVADAMMQYALGTGVCPHGGGSVWLDLEMKRTFHTREVERGHPRWNEQQLQKHRGFETTWTLWKLKEIHYCRE